MRERKKPLPRGYRMATMEYLERLLVLYKLYNVDEGLIDLTCAHITRSPDYMDCLALRGHKGPHLTWSLMEFREFFWGKEKK